MTHRVAFASVAAGLLVLALPQAESISGPECGASTTTCNASNVYCECPTGESQCAWYAVIYQPKPGQPSGAGSGCWELTYGPDCSRHCTCDTWGYPCAECDPYAYSDNCVVNPGYYYVYLGACGSYPNCVVWEP